MAFQVRDRNLEFQHLAADLPLPAIGPGARGARSIELDTGKLYEYDGATTWYEIADSNSIGVSSVVPGTGATNLGKAEDGAHTSGDVGVMALAVQKATPADISTEGDYTPLQVSGGRQWVDGNISASVAVSVTRTADTNVYAARDVLGPATGSTAALTFANMGRSAKRIMLVSAQLELDRAAVISGETSYTLYLYNITPPSALGDNVAFDIPSGDRASFLGKVNLGTPVDEGSTLYVEVNGINKILQLAGTSLFAYLVTEGTYTPASAAVHVVTLHAVEC